MIRDFDEDADKRGRPTQLNPVFVHATEGLAGIGFAG